jgi:anti-anti-sigma factor
MTSLLWAEAYRRGSPAPLVSRDGERNVVWLFGEQDIATVHVLAETLMTTSALDDTDVVVDLSEASFIDAATVGALLRSHNALKQQSRNLTLRAPSKVARRLLDICGLADLVDPSTAPL